MKIDRTKFFQLLRQKWFQRQGLKQETVDGINSILDEWEKQNAYDPRWLAYILATTKWETAHTFQPIRETGGQAYLRSKRYYPYYGRGFVQLTWDYNYEKYGIKNNPDKALEPRIAAYILIHGMVNGVFTGKKLSNYFSNSKDDPVNARRIVNGTDRAQEIAAIYRSMLEIVRATTSNVAEQEGGDPTSPVVPEGQKEHWFRRFIQWIINLFAGKG